MRKLIEKSLKSKTNLFIFMTVICFLLIVLFDFFDPNFKIHDILVEFHGLLFDLMILGVLLTIYESITSRLETIKRYTEELNDYKFWKTEEAMYRTRGLIKRLVDLKVKELDLSHCYLATDKSLSQYEDMRKWKFSGANLYDSFFMSSNMTDCNFYISNLEDSSFRDVNLTNCKFGGANLINAKFENCDFKNVKLEDAYVSSEFWFDELERNKNLNIIELVEKYNLCEYTDHNRDIRIFKFYRK
ncbi:pentapeptide repeat-containing protein [Flavobacterium psychrophilum]|nr:pentapeptide repeat-containing protein [Flavobacterium psychrophilum]AIN75180.1 hypothetical protein FPG3_07210 [Flavobacterium psychrophilum FPG3]AIN75181.1 hypothetical protein FPG3_07225 [Flavobacterium psychrophilum FPG3]EKT2068693.1 pentapeptide repeat-containing protein [Flavobacterium psychrophilum]OXB05339.1 hypothetical protein B0A57_11830 [Flavobacterium psychrophilum DSM 3660 = ATCC 49418]